MSGPYVLLADGDTDLERPMRAVLRQAGLELVAVRDGIAAHAVLVARGAPALLVADLALPKQDGFALLRALRRIEPDGQVHALLVSTFPRLRTAAEAMAREYGPLSVHDRASARGVLRRLVREGLVGRAGSSKRTSPPARLVESFLTIPDDAVERARLARIAEMRLVDEAPPDPELQALVADVATKFGVPTALLSVMLEDREWFKAYAGIGGPHLASRGFAREGSFCQHVVEGRRPLVVPDARAHPVFEESPVVRDGTVVGYAGVPLQAASGEILGTLAILDTKPLDVGADEVLRLVDAARRIAGELEVRALRRLCGVGSVAPHAPAFGGLETTLDALDMGVVLLGPRRTALYANAAMKNLFGVAPADLVGLPRDEAVKLLTKAVAHPEEQLARLRTPPSGPYVLREDVELAGPIPRVLRWVARPVILPDGIGQVLSFTDITAERMAARTEEKLARQDVLTGLLNRRGGEEALAREIARRARMNTRMSLALLDLDGFKAINDRLGHTAGDRALRIVAARVQRSVRVIDTVARWGGDEFLVLLPGADLAGARALAERIREETEVFAGAELREGRETDGDPTTRLTVSIGVAELGEHEEAADGLARADARLYEAKAAGRNRVAG